MLLKKSANIFAMLLAEKEEMLTKLVSRAPKTT
jgi:hypothetical protein